MQGASNKFGEREPAESEIKIPGAAERRMDVGSGISQSEKGGCESEAMNRDPEIEFLRSKEAAEMGCEWELFKENVRPLKRGRDVNLLNAALRSHSQTQPLNSLLEIRRELVEAIDQYQGDDPLQPWLECIRWVQEAFPAGGDSSGLIMIYEKCVRAFWHEERYKSDLRYLKVWLEYAENCADAEVIYSFLEASEIGQTHSVYYIAYALHMEGKRKMKMADDLFNRGLAQNAQPREKVEAAYRKFLARSMRKLHSVSVADETPSDCYPVRSFGTDMSSSENRRHSSLHDVSKKCFDKDGGQRFPLPIYKDRQSECSSSHELDLSKVERRPFHCLASLAERNKENNQTPAKWTSFKIPKRLEHRAGVSVSAKPVIEVFVDDDCSEVQVKRTGAQAQNSSDLQLIEGDTSGIKMRQESELLRENPLRNFPTTCLPR